MLNIAICDDNPTTIGTLREMIEKATAEFVAKTEIDYYSSGEEFYQNLSAGYKYDIVFLDICMPGSDGISIGHKIREKLDNYTLHIVYISSQKDYAMDLFDVMPLGFLIKPFEYAKVYGVIQSALRADRVNPKRICLDVAGERIILSSDRILYFEARNKKIYVYTMNGETYKFRGTIKAMYEKMSGIGFFCPHNAFLVNINRVKKWGTDSILVENGFEIPIAQTKRSEIKRLRAEYVLDNL
ncbi:MAG: LytTR family DNA-binding domain-containing protein [Lachnospiraceae bacterium]|nr:LytTR family DNA-binding domain-containing protein [Lachnospiraceae bacterium]